MRFFHGSATTSEDNKPITKLNIAMQIKTHKTAKLSHGDAVEELAELRSIQVAREAAQEHEYHEYVHHNLSSSRAMFSRMRRERGSLQ